MKTDKPQLVIFEEEKDIIAVWKDFFSDNYNLEFVNINSDLKSKIINFNHEAVFICNSYINTDLLDKIKNKEILFLVNDTKEFKRLKKEQFMVKPVYLTDVDSEIKKIHEAKFSKRYEKVKIKNLLLLPFDKKLVSPDSKETILLTEKEVSILIELTNSKKIILKEKLLTKVWGYNVQINTTTVETHIHRLRKKLKKFNKSKIAIETKKGGYSIV
tara:strand:- start:55 stop:699 length:645 start_codon:yes stop_codon:yes gene_type:complete